MGKALETIILTHYCTSSHAAKKVCTSYRVRLWWRGHGWKAVNSTGIDLQKACLNAYVWNSKHQDVFHHLLPSKWKKAFHFIYIRKYRLTVSTATARCSSSFTNLFLHNVATHWFVNLLLCIEKQLELHNVASSSPPPKSFTSNASSIKDLDNTPSEGHKTLIHRILLKRWIFEVAFVSKMVLNRIVWLLGAVNDFELKSMAARRCSRRCHLHPTKVGPLLSETRGWCSVTALNSWRITFS